MERIRPLRDIELGNILMFEQPGLPLPEEHESEQDFVERGKTKQ